MWLASPTLEWELPIVFICNKHMSALEYVFFRPKDEGKPFSLGELLDRNDSPLDSCQQGLYLFLQVWHTRSDGPWRLLGLLGLGHSTEQTRSYARSKVLALAGGMFLHFEAKYAGFPWKLCRLVSEQWTTEEKSEVIDDLMNIRECCAPVFLRHFPRVFNDRPALESSLARNVISLWAASKGLHTMTSERGHAAERAALAAASAPGQAFRHHSRKDVLRQRRLVHLANGGADPCKPPPTATGRRDCKSGGRGALVPIAPQSLLPPGRGIDLSSMLGWPDITAGAAPPLEDVPHEQALAHAAGLARRRQHREAKRHRSGKGGSVQQMYTNSCMAAAKLAKGRAPLTKEEMSEVRADAKVRFRDMSHAERSAWDTRYQVQVPQRRAGTTGTSRTSTDKPLEQYKQHFGVGEHCFPIQLAHAIAFHKRCGGFPSDDEVFKPGAGSFGFVITPGEVNEANNLAGAAIALVYHSTNLPTLLPAIRTRVVRACSAEGGGTWVGGFVGRQADRSVARCERSRAFRDTHRLSVETSPPEVCGSWCCNLIDIGDRQQRCVRVA